MTSNRQNGLELTADIDYELVARVSSSTVTLRTFTQCIPISSSFRMFIVVLQKTEGYSGSDIKLVCKEAAMRPVRKIFDALENHSEGTNTITVMYMVGVHVNPQ